jgi:hypothetical protein
MLFSVGDAGALLGGGAVVVVVVVVVVVDDGAWLPLVPQPAVNTPTAISGPTGHRHSSTINATRIHLQLLSNLSGE